MADSGNTIRYHVRVPDPKTHQIHVLLSLDSCQKSVEVSLPAWIPGSYMIRDFARNIIEISANSGDLPVIPMPIDKQTWQIKDADGGLRIHYVVYAKDLSVRGAHVDDEHAYFNGTSVFLRVAGSEHLPHVVELEVPQVPVSRKWRVATTMPASSVDERGFGVYEAPDYASLIDFPVEISAFDQLDFDVDGVPHRMVITGDYLGDLRRISRDLSKICAVQSKTFGLPLPVEKYLFQLTVVDSGYGGLEHGDSTSLICSRNDLPVPGREDVSDGYRQFLGLCAHEYFHLWNVKRIRPAGLAGADLSAEAYTAQLWAFEGFTSYYDDLALVRSGVIEAPSYLELVARNITRLLRCRGRWRQSVSESSFFAWTKFYKQDENAPNAVVSYYTKGALVSLGLDVELRQATGDRVNLDTLMKMLWQRYGISGSPVPEGGIEALASEITATDMSGFFEKYVRGTVELPLEEWLDFLGVGMRLRPATCAKDQGGQISALSPVLPARSSLGAGFEDNEGVIRVTGIVESGAAQRAGLAVGDLVMALGGFRVSTASLEDRIAEIPPGTSVEIHAFRRGALRVFRVTPEPAPEDTCDLWLLDDSDLSDTVRLRRAEWLAPPAGE